MADGAGAGQTSWQPPPLQAPNLQQVEQSTQTLLDTVSRVASAFLVLLLIGLCVAYVWVRRALHAHDVRSHKSSWTRWHKIKESLYNYCCCGRCCHAWYRSIGFDALQVGRTLRVTLFEAVKIRKQVDLYFEVWTEPAEGYPKNSRVHQRAVGKCSLGGEQLELDWYGDEEEVVLQAVQYSAMQGKDMPFAEVKIPRAYVEKYCKEAAKGTDPKGGGRLFAFRGLSKQERNLRSLRFNKPKAINPVDALPLVPSAIKSSLEEQGLALVTIEEMERSHREHPAAAAKPSASHGSHTEENLNEVPLEVALRFEFVQPQHLGAGTNAFRSSSFQASID